MYPNRLGVCEGWKARFPRKVKEAERAQEWDGLW